MCLAKFSGAERSGRRAERRRPLAAPTPWVERGKSKTSFPRRSRSEKLLASYSCHSTHYASVWEFRIATVTQNDTSNLTPDYARDFLNLYRVVVLFNYLFISHHISGSVDFMLESLNFIQPIDTEKAIDTEKSIESMGNCRY